MSKQLVRERETVSGNGDLAEALKQAKYIMNNKIAVRFEVDMEHRPDMVEVPMEDAIKFNLFKRNSDLSEADKAERRRKLRGDNIGEELVSWGLTHR